MIQCDREGIQISGSGRPGAVADLADLHIMQYPALQSLSFHRLIAQAWGPLKAVNRKASNQQYRHSITPGLDRQAGRADAAQQCFSTHAKLLKHQILLGARLLWYVFVMFEVVAPSASTQSSAVHLAACVMLPSVCMLMYSTASA